MKIDLLDQVIDHAEDLCRVYVGRNAPSEQWFETLDRLTELAKLIRRLRRTRPRVSAKDDAA